MSTRGIVTRLEKLETTNSLDQPPIVIWNDGAKDTEAKVCHLELAGRRVFLVGWKRSSRVTHRSCSTE